MPDEERDPTLTGPLEDERLRDAWRALAQDATAAPEVDDETVWRAAAGEGTLEERNAVVDAVARDPAAAESWRLARELQRKLDRREPHRRTASPARRPAGRRQAAVAAMAAMLLLALGLGFWRFVGPPSHDAGSHDAGSDEFRDPASPEVPELSSQVPEDVPQPRDRVVLSWSDAGSEARYRVRVLTPSLDPIVELRELTGTSVRLPAAPLRDVPAGERLPWQVEARFPDGRIFTSPTFFLRLAPASEGPPPPDDPQPEEP